MKFLLFLSLMMTAHLSHACSCMWDDGSLEEQVKNAYGRASAVVLARAVHAEGKDKEEYELWSEEKGKHLVSEYRKQKTQFLEVQSWKGKHAKNFYTEITIACCMCGFEFKKGETYLLYLYGPDEDQNWSTSSCSRTRPYDDEAKKEMEVLNKLGLTSASTGTL